jgi:hypothetical protein
MPALTVGETLLSDFFSKPCYTFFFTFGRDAPERFPSRPFHTFITLFLNETEPSILKLGDSILA